MGRGGDDTVHVFSFATGFSFTLDATLLMRTKSLQRSVAIMLIECCKNEVVSEKRKTSFLHQSKTKSLFR